MLHVFSHAVPKGPNLHFDLHKNSLFALFVEKANFPGRKK